MGWIISIVLFVILLIWRSNLKELEKKVQRHEQTIRMLSVKLSMLGLNDEEFLNQQTEEKLEAKQKMETASEKQNYVAPSYTLLQQNDVIKTKAKVEKQKKENGGFENLFGKHVLGFMAAILVFIGMIAFGALVLAYVSDAVKVVAMFLFSGFVTAIGSYLHKRKASPFTASVTGCGIGAIFVSIFVAHLYFGVIGDLVAFL